MPARYTLKTFKTWKSKLKKISSRKMKCLLIQNNSDYHDQKQERQIKYKKGTELQDNLPRRQIHTTLKQRNMKPVGSL